MDDIIRTVPWNRDDKDRKAQWHLTHYWHYDDGSFSECDTDGNHEDVDESDVPTPEEAEQAWCDYYRHVASTGHDPLREFVLPVQKKKKRAWQARIRSWIGNTEHGLKVTGVRRRGRGPWLRVSDAPPEVREYLGIKDRHDCIDSHHSFQQLLDDEVPLVMHGKIEAWLTFEVEEAPRPWTEERTIAWLKRKARQTLKSRRNQA